MRYKKLVLGLSLAVVIIGAAVSTSAGFAQAEDPPTCPMHPDGAPPWARRGMQAGEAGWRSDEFAGIMHEALLEAFAGALDLDPAELEAMLTSGEKIVDIAVAQGLTAEEAWDIMKGVREQVRTELLESGIDLPARGERMKGNMPFGCDGECAQDGTFPRQGGRWGGFPEGRFSDS